MRKTFGFITLAALAVVAVAQTNGSSLLAGFGKVLNEAKSVKSVYTVQTIGSSSEEYSVTLKKPNFARIDTPSQLIVADGKTITTLTKNDNTFFKRSQGENDLKDLFVPDELRLFAGFFNAEAYVAARSRTLGSRTVNGTPLQVVEATAPHRVDTYFLDNANVARKRQTDLTGPTGTVTSITTTKSVDLNSELSDDTFKFTAPSGARELSLDEINSGRWYTDFDQAMKVAKASKKRIFIDFMATWCGPCKELEKACFGTAQFKALGKNFVFCRIDVDEQPSLAKKYGATAIPLQVITDDSGTVIEQLTGWGGAQRFFDFMNRNAKNTP